MKVADIIKHLQKYDPEDSVVIAWWDSDSFDPDLIGQTSNADWRDACSYLEDRDWSWIYNELDYDLREFLKGAK